MPHVGHATLNAAQAACRRVRLSVKSLNVVLSAFDTFYAL